MIYVPMIFMFLQRTTPTFWFITHRHLLLYVISRVSLDDAVKFFDHLSGHFPTSKFCWIFATQLQLECPCDARHLSWIRCRLHHSKWRLQRLWISFLGLGGHERDKISSHSQHIICEVLPKEGSRGFLPTVGNCLLAELRWRNCQRL